VRGIFAIDDVRSG
jgi:thioredoxin reductase